MAPHLFYCLYLKYKNKFTDFFIVFVRDPLFYYFDDVFLIHIIVIILLILENEDYSIILNKTPFLPNQYQLMEYGYPLWVVFSLGYSRFNFVYD